MVTSPETNVNNLDLVCASRAAVIAENVKEEGIIGKALGVLQEDGIYAFFLYLLSLKDAKAEIIIREAGGLLKQQDLIEDDSIGKNSIHKIIPPMTGNLEYLFLAKNLLERTLIYARYHAKAYGEEKNPRTEK